MMLTSLPWDELVAVGIRTTADGPFAEDLFWQFLLPGGCVELGRLDDASFGELSARLPGLDFEKVIRAMSSTDERVFRVWHREESRYAPDRAALAARFAGLVTRLGGVASEAVFARVYEAWSGPARRYHNVEHLVDCLRALDAVAGGDEAELALWYHDVVYEPGATDCEERSARQLLADAAEMGIPGAQVAAVPGGAASERAAAAVRATAHGGAVSDPLAALVADIDLSILGRDPLRFMDYEYGVGEEYAAVPAKAFFAGRKRFLTALLAAPLFHTPAFRERYEAGARAQVAALLASARYRCACRVSSTAHSSASESTEVAGIA